MDDIPIVALVLNDDIDELVPELKEALDQLSDPRDQDNLFFTLMAVRIDAVELAELLNHPLPALNTLVEMYKQFKAELDQLPWYIRILDVNESLIDDDILLKLFIYFQLEYLDLAETIVEQDDIKGITRLRRIDHIFPTQNLDVYTSLLDISRAKNSRRYAETFEPILREHIIDASEYADIPSYLVEPNDVTADTYAQIFSEVESAEVTADTVLDLMIATSDIKYAGGDKSRVQAIAELKRIQAEDPAELQLLAKKQRTILNRLMLANNPILFKMYGPVNWWMDDPLDVEDECAIYGGCRMLLCRCFEGDAFEGYSDDKVADWFSGFCQQCLNRISSKRYAVREPLPVGGWRGCFCSRDCLIDSVIEDAEINFDPTDLSAEDVDHLKVANSALILRSIEIVFGLIKAFGIYRELPDFSGDNTVETDESINPDITTKLKGFLNDDWTKVGALTTDYPDEYDGVEAEWLDKFDQGEDPANIRSQAVFGLYSPSNPNYTPENENGTQVDFAFEEEI